MHPTPSEALVVVEDLTGTLHREATDQLDRSVDGVLQVDCKGLVWLPNRIADDIDCDGLGRVPGVEHERSAGCGVVARCDCGLIGGEVLHGDRLRARSRERHREDERRYSAVP